MISCYCSVLRIKPSSPSKSKRSNVARWVSSSFIVTFAFMDDFTTRSTRLPSRGCTSCVCRNERHNSCLLLRQRQHQRYCLLLSHHRSTSRGVQMNAWVHTSVSNSSWRETDRLSTMHKASTVKVDRRANSQATADSFRHTRSAGLPMSWQRTDRERKMTMTRDQRWKSVQNKSKPGR